MLDVHTNISNQFQNVEIHINAPERTNLIQQLEREIRSYTKTIRKIVAKKNNSFYILNISDVVKFYSKDKNNYCQTKDGDFKIKEQLYYLEEVLPRESFLRISNSSIINIEYVKWFNTDTIGKIIVEMKDGSKEIVSSRRNTSILKFLKNI